MTLTGHKEHCCEKKQVEVKGSSVGDQLIRSKALLVWMGLSVTAVSSGVIRDTIYWGLHLRLCCS